MTVLSLLVLLIVITVNTFNSPTVQYRAFDFYKDTLSVGFNDIVDVETFLEWTSVIDSMLYVENERNLQTGEYEVFYEGYDF